jgi:hypothetical protein
MVTMIPPGALPCFACDYLCDLTPALQNEIIRRTEQTGF